MYVANTTSPPSISSVLNYNQMSSFVLDQIQTAINALKVEMNPVPFLATTFLDHPVSDSSWLSGGSLVVLSDHV